MLWRQHSNERQAGRRGELGDVRGNQSGDLPDFRNLGAIIRTVVLAEFANLFTQFAYAKDGLADLSWVSGSALLFEFSLLCVVLVLFILSPWLLRMPYRQGVGVVIFLAAAVSGGVDAAVGNWLAVIPTAGPVKASAVAFVVAAAILAYFNWRQRVLSPALGESRLIALQARIRPHFLFNSINAALSVVRQDPKRAEEVLLDMSDLFRVVLAEPRALVPLENEIRLARAYLDIEQVRLGERLRVRWDCDEVPGHALVPVLLLQPLVENAVWHGIEPAPEGGEIAIGIHARNKVLRIEVSNPVPGGSRTKPSGNRMALANIGERLALHFDAEAQLRVIEEDGQFKVRVRLPLTVERGKVAKRL